MVWTIGGSSIDLTPDKNWFGRYTHGEKGCGKSLERFAQLRKISTRLAAPRVEQPAAFYGMLYNHLAQMIKAGRNCDTNVLAKCGAHDTLNIALIWPDPGRIPVGATPYWDERRNQWIMFWPPRRKRRPSGRTGRRA